PLSFSSAVSHVSPATNTTTSSATTASTRDQASCTAAVCARLSVRVLSAQPSKGVTSCGTPCAANAASAIAPAASAAAAMMSSAAAVAVVPSMSVRASGPLMTATAPSTPSSAVIVCPQLVAAARTDVSELCTAVLASSSQTRSSGSVPQRSDVVATSARLP